MPEEELTDTQKKAIKDATAVLEKQAALIKKTYYDGAGYNSQAIKLRDVTKIRQHDNQGIRTGMVRLERDQERPRPRG